MKCSPGQKTFQAKSIFPQFDNTRAKKRGGLVALLNINALRLSRFRLLRLWSWR